MPTPIIFTITAAGRLAALDAFDNGLTIALTHCAFGSGKYTPTGSETALNTELGRVGLSGGAIESVSATLRFSAALVAFTHINAFEIGLFSSTGVLFAVASTTSTTIPLTVVEPNIDTICAFGLVLGDVPASSLTITLDPNAPLAIQLVTQHAAAANPHPQYKRRLDNTERMKLAEAVDGDEAIRKDTLDALRVRLVANGVDADLGITNLISNLDSFVAVGEGFYDNTTTGTNPSIYGVAKTWRGNSAFIHQLAQTTDGKLAGRYSDNSGSTWTTWRVTANELGDSTKLFLVANGTTGNEAVNKSQLDTKAPTAGNSGQEFAVAAATTGDSAVNKTQLDALRVRLIANGIDADLAATNVITSDIDTLGTTQKGWISNTAPNSPFNYCMFEVVALNGSDSIQIAKNAGQEAYRYGSGGVDHAGHTWSDWAYRANRNGDSNQLFSAADGTSGKQVVNRDQLDTKSAKAGDNTQVFKVAAAAANEDAVRLDQLTSMGGAIKVAILQMIYQVGQPYFNKTDARNPNDIFGVTVGTWVQEKGRFLVGFDDTQDEFDLLAATGGAKSHVMTLSNLIEHDHDIVDKCVLDVAANNSVGLGTDHKDVTVKTGKTGSATPTPIPTLPPYVVYSWWVRTA